MSIIHIEGPNAEVIGNAIRNSQIGQGKGALLVLEGSDGEPVHLLEKIIAGDPLEPGTKAKDINWKEDPTVILIGSNIDLMGEFEELVPGFKKQFGPVTKMTLSKAK